jgi:hypothetical protein
MLSALSTASCKYLQEAVPNAVRATLMKLPLLLATAALLSPSAAAQNAAPQVPYVWRSVALGGGGNVPDIVLHPKVRDLHAGCPLSVSLEAFSPFIPLNTDDP